MHINHTCMHACMHTRTHTCIHACIHKFIHTYIHTDMHASRHRCMHACIHTGIHTHIYISYLTLSSYVWTSWFQVLAAGLRHATARAPCSSASASAVRRFAGTSHGALADVGNGAVNPKGIPWNPIEIHWNLRMSCGKAPKMMDESNEYPMISKSAKQLKIL